MAINKVAGDNSYLFKNNAVTSKQAEKTSDKKVEKDVPVKAETEVDTNKNKLDTVEKADTTPSVTYTKPEKTYAMDINKVNELISDSERRMENFQQLLSGLMQNQSGTYKVFMMGQEFNVDQKTVDAAKKSLEPGGDQSVQVVADRIVAMAKALTGGDPSKVDEMKAAALKGFKQAEEVWGGKLPDISQQTYNEVMKQFDSWAETGKVSAETK